MADLAMIAKVHRESENPDDGELYQDLQHSIKVGFLFDEVYESLNHADATAVLQDLIARAPTLHYRPTTTEP